MRGPLSGINVLDFGIVGTGPKTALLLAWLGATVTKIESPRFPDPFRAATMYPKGAEVTEPWNMAVGANANNRHKRSVCLDYLAPEGRTALDRIIGRADVILHNFRLSVADKAGLTWERVSAVNPRAVLIALSSQGDSGPRRNYGSYGATLEALGGIGGLIGTPEAPLITSVNYPDQACPLFASGVIVRAILDRDLTGEGAWIDFGQVEATTLLTGDVVVAAQEGPDVQQLAEHARDIPSGVFPCTGEDEWVAVEVTGNDSWAALCELIGTDPKRGNGPEERRRNALEINASLAVWTSQRSGVEAESSLRSAGIAAARVLRGPDVLEHPALLARDYFEDLDSSRLGSHRYNGNPLGRDLIPDDFFPVPAARMGEHNREFMIECGFTHSEIDNLEARGILSTRPLGGSDE